MDRKVSQKTEYDVYDPESGQKKKAVFTQTIEIKSKMKRKDMFSFLFQQRNEQYAIDLPASALRMMVFLFCICEYNNEISLSLREISDRMKIKKRAAQNSIALLVDLNVLLRIKDKDDARRSKLIINPAQMWKGTLDARNKKVKELRAIGAGNQAYLPKEKKALLPNNNFDNE